MWKASHTLLIMCLVIASPSFAVCLNFFAHYSTSIPNNKSKRASCSSVRIYPCFSLKLHDLPPPSRKKTFRGGRLGSLPSLSPPLRRRSTTNQASSTRTPVTATNPPAAAQVFSGLHALLLRRWRRSSMAAAPSSSELGCRATPALHH
jgi:hypothetical protein